LLIPKKTSSENFPIRHSALLETNTPYDTAFLGQNAYKYHTIKHQSFYKGFNTNIYKEIETKTEVYNSMHCPKPLPRLALNDITLMAWNCRSLGSHEKKAWVKTFDVDVIALNETWGNTINLPGYLGYY